MMWRLLAMLLMAAALNGCAQDAITPKGPIGPRMVQLPSSYYQRYDDVTVYTLENGLTLIHRESRDNEIVGLVMYVRTGAAQDADAKIGTTNLMMRVLSKGTKSRTSDQIAEELGMLGASLSPSPSYDHCKVTLQCVNEDLDGAMDLFADVLLNPLFPVDELDLERKKVLAQIRMGEDQASVIASKRFQKELFGGHAYGRPMEGTAETLENITAHDLYEQHRENFVPSNMVLSVVGAVPFEGLRELTEKHLGAVELERKPRYDVDKIIAPAGGRTELAKEAEQGFIILGHLTCAAGDRDEPAVELASAILGSGMSSRLFTELRDKQGLAYAVGSSSVHFRNQGYLATYIGTGPATIDRAADGLWSEVRKLREGPVQEEELQRAKNYIAGQYLRQHERNLQQAGFLGYWHLTGRGVDYDKQYLEDINAVTSRDVMRVANKYLLEPTVVVVRPIPKQAIAASTP